MRNLIDIRAINSPLNEFFRVHNCSQDENIEQSNTLMLPRQSASRKDMFILALRYIVDVNYVR